MPTAKQKLKNHKVTRRIKVELPGHVVLSEDELSSVVQWIRLRRNCSIWTGALIQALLDWDSNLDTDPAYRSVRDMIAELEKLEERIDNFTRGKISHPRPHKSEYPAFTRYFAAVVNKYSDISLRDRIVLPKSEEDEFYEILQLWRKEYPEPPKQIQRPSGHLGRGDESGD